MIDLKLLVVEDAEEDIELCRRAARRHNGSGGDSRVSIIEADDVEEAKRLVDKTFDGAIIDLRIGNDEHAGNRVIQEIEAMELCIPVIILTGTPSRATQDLSHIELIRKGDPGSAYNELFVRFRRIYATGVTKILGGRGVIESRLGEVFRQHLAPQITTWERYGSHDSAKTERALLRHTLYHLVQLIDEDTQDCFPEEFYLHSPPNEQVRTGSIVENAEDGLRYVVMSPDCDLIIRDTGRNTDMILLVQIVEPTDLFDWFDEAGFDSLSNNRKGQLKNALNNKGNFYYHCLPDAENTRLGFMDFRRLMSVPEECLDSGSDYTGLVQISPPFLKDIISRFSSYYARQGQPEVNFDEFLPTN